MMQGLVLTGDAPLYGRAREILDIGPMEANLLARAFPGANATTVVEHYAAWGGIPWYWELAAEARGSPKARIDELVLDPLGPLHQEPDRLLIEEMPSALELRPILDAIGAGAHRVSEIAGRLGRPATSLSRPLVRLVDMGIVRREVPFGEPERRTKKSLYQIADPFFRLWFRVVAPYRSLLASAQPAVRLSLLDRHYPQLLGAAWEDLCRAYLPRSAKSSQLGRLGPWANVGRWWSGGAPEWDLVSESTDGRRLLFGEAKWSARPFPAEEIARACQKLAEKPAPSLGAGYSGRETIRVLLVPAVRGTVRSGSVVVVTADELLGLRT
jgi:AAA+ ATPase superfamily predicted ATPase